MSEKLTAASFKPLMNETFEIEVPGVGNVEVKLVEMEEKGNDTVESFSLIFKGAKNKFFNQGTHKVTHEKLGENDIFLVPVGEKGDQVEYQAIFSRLKEA